MSQMVYRFGNFVVESGSRSLLRDGTRVPLQEQPFQVLLAMLERPGQIVSRDALRLRLWGNNIFVDFDQSLNSAVRRLRMALGDSPRTPTHVETLPRLGFRFLPAVSVENVQPTHGPSLVQSAGAKATLPAVLQRGSEQRQAGPASLQVARG